MSKYVYIVVSYMYVVVALKDRTPKNFKVANFGHTVSKSWLRP